MVITRKEGKLPLKTHQTDSDDLNEINKITEPPNQSISISDEIRKLAKLKEEGLITEEEFKQMKQDLIRKNNC